MQKPVTPREIQTFLQLDASALMGPPDTPLKAFVSPNSETPESLAFINHPKWMKTAEDSKVSCLLVPLQMKDKVSPETTKTWIFCKNVDLAAREIKNTYVFSTPYRPLSGIHPTALISESAVFGNNCHIGPYAVIGAHCKIGEDCYIGAHTILEEGVELGQGCTIHPQVYIGHSCQLGDFCEIKPQAVIGSEGFGYAHDSTGEHHRIPHTGRVVLEERVHVGAGTTIDRGSLEDTRIGAGTKIDNQCHLAHNTVVGKRGLITGQVVTAGSTTIGDNFICGGKTAITGHITITDNVNIAGLSGVANSVTEPGAYGGYPLLPLKKHLKVKASSTHLPEMRKQLQRLMKKVFPDQNQT